MGGVKINDLEFIIVSVAGGALRVLQYWNLSVATDEK